MQYKVRVCCANLLGSGFWLPKIEEELQKQELYSVGAKIDPPKAGWIDVDGALTSNLLFEDKETPATPHFELLVVCCFG